MADCAPTGSPDRSCPIGARPGTARAAGAAKPVSGPRGERHRHLFARLSPGARAELRAGPPSSLPGGAVARASPAGLLLRPSFSPSKSARHCRALAPVPTGGPGEASVRAGVGTRVPSSIAPGPLQPGTADRSPADFVRFPLLLVYSRGRSRLGDIPFTRQHANPFLRVPGPRNRRVA